jgi:hypothetical protein
MKNIFLTLALILISTIGKSQNIVELYVNETYLFEYSDTLSFMEAWKNELVRSLELKRTYLHPNEPWVIDMGSREIRFYDEPARPIISIEKENTKLEYINYKGIKYKLFMMTEVGTEKDMVFFLMEPKDGKIMGGFGYPTRVEYK